MRILYSLLFFISFSVCSAQLVTTISGGIVTGYTGTGDTLVIPSEWEGVAVTQISSNAFSSTNLVSVTLPDTIEIIEPYAFAYCSLLSNINL